jgi:hypothetical protein
MCKIGVVFYNMVIYCSVLGTNDVFVTIALGKEKYQTSVKEKASGSVEWHEECEL